MAVRGGPGENAKPPRKPLRGDQKRLLEIDAALDSGDISPCSKGCRAVAIRNDSVDRRMGADVQSAQTAIQQASRCHSSRQMERTALSGFFFSRITCSPILRSRPQTYRSFGCGPAIAQNSNRTTLPPSNLEEKFRLYKSRCNSRPEGTYEIKLKNDLSGEVQTIVVRLEAYQDGQWSGKKIEHGAEPSSLRSSSAGANRLWLIVDGPFGPLELRIAVTAAPSTAIGLALRP